MKKIEEVCVLFTQMSVCIKILCISVIAGSSVGSLRARSHHLNWRLYLHVRQQNSTSGSGNETQRFVLLN